ncbi:MAG: exodeoxyribonuclease VII large subunit [Planctomycetota bacterium]
MTFKRGLFDTDLIQAPSPEKDSKTGRPKTWTVSQLTAQIKDCIEHSFGSVWVEGELSNFRVYSSGHCYFSLKDDTAQLSAVMWRGTVERLRFTPEDGKKVLACGRLTVYESRGQYQIVVDRLELLGVGDLAAAFEQLKKKLAAEGLFNAARKRPIPAIPRRIGIVTSPTGAAIHDLMKVIYARWPADILLCGARVQGAGAAAEIAQGIELLNGLADADRPDVLIVGRGGGSLEDLWAFNEELVARAIFKSEIPVISAVGHEIDFTISDFVADMRAATPSHAGELVVPRLNDMLARLSDLRAALPQALLRRVEVARRRLEAIERSYALRHPDERIGMLRQRLDDIFSRLIPAGERRLSAARERLAACVSRLDSLSPLKVLDRGYSVTLRDHDGKIVKSTRDVAAGEQLLTRVKDGTIRSRVEKL